MLPQLIMYREMGAYNNYAALLLPFLYPYGFYVYLYKGFFDQIPGSYFEAAELDGAGSFYLYTRICMPLSKPIISGSLRCRPLLGTGMISSGHGWSQKIRSFGH